MLSVKFSLSLQGRINRHKILSDKNAIRDALKSIYLALVNATMFRDFKQAVCNTHKLLRYPTSGVISPFDHQNEFGVLINT